MNTKLEALVAAVANETWDLRLEIRRLEAANEKLQEIADMAYDLHTRDPVNVKNKWGVCGSKAEELLCKKIEALKGGDLLAENKRIKTELQAILEWDRQMVGHSASQATDYKMVVDMVRQALQKGGS